VVGVPKEDQAQDRDGVFVGFELGVGPQLVCDVPETFLDVGVIRGHRRFTEVCVA